LTKNKKFPKICKKDFSKIIIYDIRIIERKKEIINIMKN